MLQEFLQWKSQRNEKGGFRVNSNVREGAKPNRDSPTCDDTDRTSEVLGSNKNTKKSEDMRSEDEDERDDESGAFSM